MVSFTQITSIMVIALAANTQAGPLKIIPKLIGGVLGQRDLSERDLTEARFIMHGLEVRGQGSIFERAGVATDKAALEAKFNQCVAALHTKKPTVETNPDKSVTVTGVPKICIDQAKAWNAQPNIATINQKQGSILVKGADSLKLVGMTPEVLKEFEGLA